jgi:hypothetical protein
MEEKNMELKERTLVERELSSLMEMTLGLEDELNSVIKYG